jgi:hypothetical protein
MMIKTTTLDLLLNQVFDDARSDLHDELTKKDRIGDYEKLKRDFVFHMTDWMDDLRRLYALEQVPDVWETERATEFLIGFLYHAIPHLNAAGRLLLDEIPDPFARDESARLLETTGEVGPAKY